MAGDLGRPGRTTAATRRRLEARQLAAQRMALRLRAAADSLRDYPERGRSIPGGRRELTIINPYLIRYRCDGEIVVILRTRHGARGF